MTIVIQAKGKNQSEDAFFRNKAASVKGAVNVPVMAVGGVRNLGTAKDIIQSGHADLVSMCRPFVREPGLIARWQNGDGADAKCISCNKCLNAIVAPILKKEPRVPLRCQEEIVA